MPFFYENPYNLYNLQNLDLDEIIAWLHRYHKPYQQANLITPVSNLAVDTKLYRCTGEIIHIPFLIEAVVHNEEEAVLTFAVPLNNRDIDYALSAQITNPPTIFPNVRYFDHDRRENVYSNLKFDCIYYETQPIYGRHIKWLNAEFRQVPYGYGISSNPTRRGLPSFVFFTEVWLNGYEHLFFDICQGWNYTNQVVTALWELCLHRLRHPYTKFLRRRHDRFMNTEEQ